MNQPPRRWPPASIAKVPVKGCCFFRLLRGNLDGFGARYRKRVRLFRCQKADQPVDNFSWVVRLGSPQS